MSTLDKILLLIRQLFPTGRAFKIPYGGILDKLNKALLKRESIAYDDAISILNSTLPDNSAFTSDDATDWEKRLGLITNTSVSLTNRKLAIQRKLNHPGTIPARQNYLYLEGQLRSAGFDVYVHENRFPDGSGGFYTRTPLDVSGGLGGTSIQHGDRQHGDIQMGGVFENIVVNDIDVAKDKDFNFAGNMKSSFFIGGNPVGVFANVDANRMLEFRQLILKIKPTQTVGILFINYI